MSRLSKHLRSRSNHLGESVKALQDPRMSFGREIQKETTPLVDSKNRNPNRVGQMRTVVTKFSTAKLRVQSMNLFCTKLGTSTFLSTQ